LHFARDAPALSCGITAKFIPKSWLCANPAAAGAAGLAFRIASGPGKLASLHHSLTGFRRAQATFSANDAGRMSMIALSINGQSYNVDVESDTPLLWVIRDTIGLTGTKYGCGIAQCGACTVHIDGVATRSCQVPVGTVGEKHITTIEALAQNGKLHPVQQAWLDLDVPQCGYCQSGMLMAAAALLRDKPKPTDADINAAMTNICRCGTYQRIRAAIHAAANNA
jgi:isoquinoline 1-oxidoreductase alpha subunit